MQRKTLTAQEVADYIGIHKETVYVMVRKKEIPHIRIRRRIFFSQETIDTWLHEQELKSFEAM
ncbi:helix-turn-helix domain-containing protein [Bacillus sp. V3B]|uniref:helix-turn-helix domain-containing protein n=1 Tax=Bacillus sp. V3B TaxID=2804915 RepID=UPI002109551E|nr:helix-turn-helix domain-containing protein [Bacillus sp. V3B]MCQ6275785.1 helix-turn-helix domain-containing protein [Bacillus sp. V3B]